MERVHALGEDAARKPLHHVAARAPLQQRRVREKGILHPQVELESQVERPLHHLRAIQEREIGVGRADQLVDKVEAVDEDKVAETEFAGRAFYKQLELVQITLRPGRVGGQGELVKRRPSRRRSGGTMEETQPVSGSQIKRTSPPSNPP